MLAKSLVFLLLYAKLLKVNKFLADVLRQQENAASMATAEKTGEQ
jgi:hypothetical protein